MRLVSVWVAWIVLVPALALACPARRPRSRPKKPPATKPADAAERAGPRARRGDATPAGDEGRDARPRHASPAGTAGGGGGGGTGPANGAAGGGAGDAKADARQAEPAEADKPATGDGDVDTLRQEYLSLRDELFKSRARANAVASQLYSTRIQIKLTYTSARYYSPIKASIRLDGASVYEDATGAIAGDDGIRFDGYVAPGRHLVTFRVEATGKDDDSFTSVDRVADRRQGGRRQGPRRRGEGARTAATSRTSGRRSEKGSYGLGIDVAVKTAARAAGDPKGAGDAKGAKK